MSDRADEEYINPPDVPGRVALLGCQEHPAIDLAGTVERPFDERVSAPVAMQPGMFLSVMYLRFLYFQQSKDLAGCRATAEMWEKVLSGSDAASRPMPWPNSLYNAACMRAVIAAMVNVGSTTPAPDTTRKAEEETDLAMAWLQKAVAAGFKNIEHMKKDKDLGALRERQDFQKLLGESQEAAKEKKKK